MRFIAIALAWMAVIVLSTTAPRAEIPLEGRFVAERACPLFQSIRKQTNPGNHTAAPGSTYDLLAKNRDAASHFLIDVPQADPRRRWIAVECGEPIIESNGVANPSQSDKRPQTILAFSWQPAFCETRAGRHKPECKSLSNDRFDASNFTLHGLWPRGQYCGVPRRLVEIDRRGDWADLTPVELAEPIARELQQVMPGTRSLLDRHEWIRHGTCYENRSQQAYFRDSLNLMREINASPLRDLFAANIGREVSAEQIVSAFDAQFGRGAGERLRIACVRDGDRLLIREITLGLSGNIAEKPDMVQLIANAPPTDRGCRAGIIDPVGDQ